ncbi:MAG TPA: LUD domain-containing protein [Myxococcota bacterium]|nr:LUD domain-containing protein [Myxococcota bacterium]
MASARESIPQAAARESIPKVGARESILAAVRRARPAVGPLPPGDEAWLGSLDLAADFARALDAAGGRCARAATPDAVDAELEADPAYRRAGRIYAAVPGIRRANAGEAELADARAGGALDFAVVPGRLGVAESGAVWIDGDAVADRAVLWLAEHLAIVLPAAALVDHLHAAYARLRFEGACFGVFVAGPSKTADIEQALVIGAQGPRSTLVILV